MALESARGTLHFCRSVLLPCNEKDLLPHVSSSLQYDDRWLPYNKDRMKLIQYIWTNLPHDSGLKKLIIDVWAFDQEWELTDELAALLPTELWTGLMKKVFARLPNRLCKTCVYNACEDHENEHWQYEQWCDYTVAFDAQVDSPFYGKEVTPFDFDMCLYHEHQDYDERNACKEEAAAKTERRQKRMLK